MTHSSPAQHADLWPLNPSGPPGQGRGIEWPGSEEGSQGKSVLLGPSLRLACSVLSRPGSGQEAGALLLSSL